MSELPDPSPELPQQQGISLDELTEAFAQAMGGRTEPEIPPDEGADETFLSERSEPAGVPEGDPSGELAALTTGDSPEPDDATENGGPCQISPQTILEAMLFVGDRENEPLSPARAAELMRGVTSSEIRELVDELNRRYASSGCPYRVKSVGAGYRLALGKAFQPVRNKFYGRARQARLSQAAVEVLSILAYRQPLAGEQVSRLRGTPSGHILSQLVRRRLLRVERPPGKRRTAHYYTTHRFLELFGLESLADLPQSEELEKQ